MWVNFSISENELLRYREEVAKGRLLVSAQSTTSMLSVVLADGTEFPNRGHISFTNPAFSTQTGTFLVRASFANPKGILRPGQFVRARVSGASRPNAILVPQRAVLQGAKSHFVWVVDNDSKAHQRVVEVGEWHGDDWFITEGLQAGRAGGGRRRDPRVRRHAAEDRRGAGRARCAQRAGQAAKAVRRSIRPPRPPPTAAQ